MLLGTINKKTKLYNSKQLLTMLSISNKKILLTKYMVLRAPTDDQIVRLPGTYVL